MRLTRRSFTAGATAFTFSPVTEGKEEARAPQTADLILVNGRFTTLDETVPNAEAAAITDGRFSAVGTERDVRRLAGPKTQVIDLKGRRAIPGLIDSHMHIIRGGLNYNMELRWDDVPSLADAMRMLKTQVERRPHRNGCAWWVVSPNISSPSAACRRSMS